MAWLVWMLCAVCLMLAVLGLGYGAQNHPSLKALLTGVAPPALFAMSFPVVGALIATYRPQNPLGWIFCAVGLSQALVVFLAEYGVYALRTAPVRCRGAVGDLGCPVGLGAWHRAAAHLRPLAVSHRLAALPPWRPVAWLSALPIVLIPALTAPTLWPYRGVALVGPSRDEPLGQGLAMVELAVFWLMVGCGLACLAALALRFRRSRGIERQQLKWFLFACVITVTIFR